MRGRGWRAVVCFFSAILWRVPRFFWAIGSPFRTETLSGIRLGYGAGRSPPVPALRQQAGRALFYRIIF